jgi:hypothetical protein
MNQNDMDRYYWRTGHYWSGDRRALEEIYNINDLSFEADRLRFCLEPLS